MRIARNVRSAPDTPRPRLVFPAKERLDLCKHARNLTPFACAGGASGHAISSVKKISGRVGTGTVMKMLDIQFYVLQRLRLQQLLIMAFYDSLTLCHGNPRNVQ